MKKSITMNENTPILEYLQAVKKFHTGRPLPNGFKYSCIEAFVLERGRLFTPKPLSSNITPGEIKCCYKNAFELMVARKDLIYVEGYAQSIIAVLHAWCVNDKGEVIDPTWTGDTPMGTAYYGVPFDREYAIRQMLKKSKYGLLDDWENGYPLLQTEGTEFLFKGKIKI